MEFVEKGAVFICGVLFTMARYSNLPEIHCSLVDMHDTSCHLRMNFPSLVLSALKMGVYPESADSPEGALGMPRCDL